MYDFFCEEGSPIEINWACETKEVKCSHVNQG
jgi:hypothetical protein